MVTKYFVLVNNAMHSRAYLLLKRDLDSFKRSPIEGLSAAPVSNDDLYKWSAKIEGLRNSAWEGGVFRLNVTFSDEYNAVPPLINFMTIPFHPNIHPDTGVPSCGLLSRENWNEDCTLQSLLLVLQSLLSNPETDSGCVANQDAARAYLQTPHTYGQMASDCVTASLRIQAGMSPYNSEVGMSRPHSQPLSSSPLTLLPPSTSYTGTHQVKAVSFDDYHMFWKGLATSVSGNNTGSKNKKDSAFRLYQSKEQKTASEQRHVKEIENKMASHLTFKYGISKTKGSSSNKPVMDNEYRQKRVTHLMDLYTSKKKDEDIAASCGNEETKCITDIDELLKWTNSLDEKELNA